MRPTLPRLARLLSYSFLAAFGALTVVTHPALVTSLRAEDKELSREKLEDTIKLMLEELEEEKVDWLAFFKEFSLISDPKDEPPKEMVEEMGKAVGPTLIKVLKAIQTKTPTSKSDTEVAYDVKELVENTIVPPTFTLVYKDKKWVFK
ncbi:hypothetical protein DB346_22205 [Verrucomicrobia bacterium LW23]|nr:hypothetical protein DB346_22205 [Verrucomicrobia bacterium LW23]